MSDKTIISLLFVAGMLCCQTIFSQLIPAYKHGSSMYQYLQKEFYKEWQWLSPGINLSVDGKWMSWNIRNGKGAHITFIRNNSSGRIDSIVTSTVPLFSANSQWVLYRNGDEIYECISLCNEIKQVLPRTTDAFFSGNGQFLITLGKDSSQVGYTKRLEMIDLRTKRKLSFSGVILLKPDKTRSKIAVLKTENNIYSVLLLDLNTGAKKVLIDNGQRLSELDWNENGKGLIAVKRANSEVQKVEEVFLFDLVSNKNLVRKITIHDVLETPIVEKVKLGEDNKTLIFRTGGFSFNKPSSLPVWHWADHSIEKRLQYHFKGLELPESVQQWIYHIDGNNCLEVIAENESDLTSSSSGKFFMLNDRLNYQSRFKESESKLYLIEGETGKKDLLGEKIVFPKGWDAPKIAEISPNEHYVIFFKSNSWWSYDLKNKKKQNLTENEEHKFYKEEYDNSGTPPPYGFGGWDRKGVHIYLYDEFDIYKVRLDGLGGERITNGRERNIVFRFAGNDLEIRSLKIIDLSNRLVLSAFQKSTGSSGYFELYKGELKSLIYGNCRYSSIVKAIGTDVYSFIMERVDASPSVWLKVGSKPPQLITSTNPQQKNYYWTRSEMIQYRNRKGKPLHGALFYPANYKPGKKYPLVVHVYERLSQYLHHYVQPENVSYGVFNFTQGDYFIFTPDISFEIDNPGMSAVDCVVPAVEQVIKNEGVDKGRLGLMGHSWGGYLTTFIISQTDLFKAAVAGAPPTDLVSLSLSLRWENGSTNQLFEGGQARFSGPFYDRQEAYIRNSSVYQSKNIHTPLLLAFGDKDGFVDWRQGIELYNALRRQKKSCLFLYYQGSGHQNLPEDYATKQIEFFNHYLKGKQAPEWMGWADK